MTTLDLFKHDYVLSIRPTYATKIVEGLKTVELRRRFPDLTVTGAKMYVYATAPVQAIVGYATIVRVERRKIDDIWRTYHAVSYINHDAFKAYFQGVDQGFVLVLSDPVQLNAAVGVNRLKAEADFIPPQSFAYADEKIRRLVSAQETTDDSSHRHQHHHRS